MRKQKAQIQKIVKEYKDATPLEIWEGFRDNFIFGFLGATLVVFIATKTDIAVLVGYLTYYFFMGYSLFHRHWEHLQGINYRMYF